MKIQFYLLLLGIFTCWSSLLERRANANPITEAPSLLKIAQAVPTTLPSKPDEPRLEPDIKNPPSLVFDSSLPAPESQQRLLFNSRGSKAVILVSAAASQPLGKAENNSAGLPVPATPPIAPAIVTPISPPSTTTSSLVAATPGLPQPVKPTLAQNPAATPPSTTLPSKLQPNPALLEVPTQRPQVQIELTQPLTLAQAQALALKNNRNLQVAELQLQQQRAGLRRSQAALFPTLQFQSTFSRSFGGSNLVTSQPSLQQQSQLQQQQIGQTQQEFQQQLFQAQQQLERDLDNLQQRFQGAQIGASSDQRNLEFQQQLQLLQQSATTVANTIPVTPNAPSPLFRPSLNLGIGTGGTDSTNNTFTHALSLNYSLYSGGSRQSSIRSAKEQVKQAGFEVQRQTDQLRLDVSLDYYNAQQANAQVEIAQAALSNAQISLRDAQSREQAGLGTKFDVLQAQVTLANALQNLNQATNLQRISRRQLAQRLSLAETADVLPAEPVAPSGNWQLGLPESIILAYNNRVELQQQLSRREIAIQGRRAALSALRPRVNFFANVNSLDELFDSVTPRMGYSLGVQLNMSLFDGGSARAEADQQALNINQAELDFASTKDQIRIQVEQAFFNLQANQQNLESSRIAVEQAQEGLRLARLRFQAGVGRQADVTEAEADLTRAQGNFLAATLDYNRALANIRRAVGYALPK